MGYTHYWQRTLDGSSDSKQYDQFCNGVEKLIKQAVANGIEVADAFGDELGAWEITSERVAFNGYGDNSHETFSWYADCPPQHTYSKNDPLYFDFCKTQYKPYDALVTATLIHLKRVYGDQVQISSDGNWEDWEAGRELYRQTLGYQYEESEIFAEIPTSQVA